MGLPLQPAVGPAPLPAPAPGAGALAQAVSTTAPSSIRALVTAGGTESAASAERNNAKSNSTSQEARGGGVAEFARQALDLPEFPAPPISDLEIPVALIDLPRLSSSARQDPPQNSKPEPQAEEAKRQTGTAFASQHRVQDGTLSDSLTPPAEVRIADDVTRVREFEQKSEASTLDVAR